MKKTHFLILKDYSEIKFDSFDTMVDWLRANMAADDDYEFSCYVMTDYDWETSDND